jgi:hypothetical protein
VTARSKTRGSWSSWTKPRDSGWPHSCILFENHFELHWSRSTRGLLAHVNPALPLAIVGIDLTLSPNVDPSAGAYVRPPVPIFGRLQHRTATLILALGREITVPIRRLPA